MMTETAMATQAHKLEISADPDAELVAAAQQGDLHAFDILVRRHESRIYRLAQRITGNAQDAEDVLQEAFLNAYRKLYQFHGESHFYTWLVRITVNQGLMRLRRQKRRSMVSITGETESGATAPLELRDWRSNPEQQFAAEEMAAVLNRGIAGLAAPYRMVFQLRDIEELSNQETADILHLSVPAVKSRLLRARLKLRELLAPYFDRVPAGPLASHAGENREEKPVT